mmetsp:Transcript_7207/g.15734  ORF Transcript_7207/g.15734 Transcript_7207/m.15734 type:complete len:446 (+) Transcript_7207:122-1459(+)|eukprot:CAMPEP_0202918566 /NCGR_PEP_ID=MMETSP1392-20130828/73753_1 /ASSEMBLY_ACC=CAM_ASM_000868 /TAXON_ID=225041 /ORGANISM="Chlamydomonas chlamydogama, Strain SAG 11-48b" /LENGTH=445 /DNA_ID=CAMNT_0049611667 /DNA_START=85 /DNA_END=1422 /DNA_ORIENTATION=+
MGTCDTISDLEPQCLLQIFSHLSARDCARAALVQRIWRDIAQDNSLFRQFLWEDYGWDAPTKPSNEACASYRLAYGAWATEFGADESSYIKRSVTAWKSIEAFLTAHHPAIKSSLQPGASEQDIRQAEEALGCKLHPALKAIYRLRNGQTLKYDQCFDEQVEPRNHEESVFHGMFGGYSFYDELVSVRMLPLDRMIKWTTVIQNGRLVNRNQILFAASFNFKKLFVVNSADASISVVSPGVLLPAVPTVAGAEDGVLRWLEEYARRLSCGYYCVELLDPELSSSASISLFPAQAPGMVKAVTRGVQVRGSCLYVPEHSPPGRNVFTYSIRFSLLPHDEQRQHWPATAGPPRVLDSCQLMTRHWIIRNAEGEEIDEVRGEAVVGKFPLLRPGEPEFVYQSCTNQQAARGYMEGDFTFVEGNIAKPTGPEWDVVCPRFVLEVPNFIF